MAKKNNTLGIVVIVAVLVIGGIFAISQMGFQFGETETAPTEQEEIAQAVSGCPSDGTTSLKLDIYNSANLTGSEGIDQTVYVFNKETGVLELTITDTTSPNASDLGCGKTYVAKTISTSGASGDQSVFDSVSGDAKIVDGNLEFTTKTATLNLIAQTEQHATLECRAYDNIQKGLMYDSSDATATDYETDGVTFTSTIDNSTPSDETNGMDIDFECRAVQSDTDYNDRGVLVLLEMPTTKWDKPAVYVNGAKIEEITLEGNEADAYVDYEYAFLIPSSVVMKDGSEGFNVRVVNSLKAGISSVTNDPEIDFAVRGQYLATNGLEVKEGAVTDASSPAQVHNLYDITIDQT